MAGRNRRIKFARRRVVEDPEDNDVDETPACQIIMAQRKEVVAGKPMAAGRIEVEMLFLFGKHIISL